MEGDEDWVSTSPIKLALPPARRAFTPGRVLSRDEIRQQRRRAPDHPQPRLNSLQSTSKALFDQASAQPARRNDAAQIDGDEGPAARSSTSAHQRTTPTGRSPRRDDNSARAQACQQDLHVISDPTAGSSGSPRHIRKYGQITFPPMPSPTKATVPSSSLHPLGVDERQVDVSVRVGTRVIAEARVRESVSPVPDPTKVTKRLFNPSPSSSTSPDFPPFKADSHAVDEGVTRRPGHVRAEEEDALPPGGSPVASEALPAASSHVSEDLPSPSPPRKRIRKADIIDNYDHGQDNGTGDMSSPKQTNSTKKQKRSLSTDDSLAKAADLAAQSFQGNYAYEDDVQVRTSGHRQSVSPQPSTDIVNPAVQRRKPQMLDSLQGLIDWTWPAVQQSLKDSRSSSAISTSSLQKLENYLHRQLTSRTAKLEELQDLQLKRRREAEKTRKIQTERTSLAIRMREEERLWQKSRRAFRINVGLHEAAVRVAAEAARALHP